MYLLEEPTRMRMESAQWYGIHKKFSRWISRIVIILIANFFFSTLASSPPEEVGSGRSITKVILQARPRTRKSCLYLQEWAVLCSSNPRSHFCALFLHPVLFSKAARSLHFHPHSWSDTVKWQRANLLTAAFTLPAYLKWQITQLCI